MSEVSSVKICVALSSIGRYNSFLIYRNILMHPINNMQELQRRLDFIQFATASTHQGFIESLQDNIKKISDITVSYVHTD